MSRVIKYRVWNGTEMVYDVTVGKFGIFYVNPSNNGLDAKDSASITPFTTKYHDGTPVMQFTGLLDKDKQEIYEGDLVERNGHIYKVTFESGGFCLTGREFEPLDQITIMHHDRFLNNFLPGLKVIGDIYSTPNILGDSTTLKKEKV
jgi:uncharacterized phage protein (TIGR01671 family)